MLDTRVRTGIVKIAGVDTRFSAARLLFGSICFRLLAADFRRSTIEIEQAMSGNEFVDALASSEQGFDGNTCCRQHHALSAAPALVLDEVAPFFQRCNIEAELCRPIEVADTQRAMVELESVKARFEQSQRQPVGPQLI